MNITNNITLDIIDFLDDIDNLTNECIDKLELTPIKLDNNLYVTGLRRTPLSYTDVELHIREIKNVNISANITEEMISNATQLYINANLIDEAILKIILRKLQEEFNKLTQIHLITTKHKNITKNLIEIETIAYNNKRLACKETIQKKKIYKDLKVTFQHINKDNNNNIIKEPTEFEIATAAVTT